MFGRKKEAESAGADWGFFGSRAVDLQEHPECYTPEERQQIPRQAAQARQAFHQATGSPLSRILSFGSVHRGIRAEIADTQQRAKVAQRKYERTPTCRRYLEKSRQRGR